MVCRHENRWSTGQQVTRQGSFARARRAGCFAELLPEIDRLDLVAVGIEEESAEIGRERGLARARIAGRSSATRQRRRMKFPNRVLRRRAQADVDAGRFRLRREAFARVQPELGIFLAKADGRPGEIDNFGKTKRRQNRFIERRAARNVRHGHGDMVDHLTSTVTTSCTPRAACASPGTTRRGAVSGAPSFS